MPAAPGPVLTDTQARVMQKVAEGGLPTAVLLGAAWFLSGELDQLAGEVNTLKEEFVAVQVRLAGEDRWTASDHRDYARALDTRLRAIEDRLTHIEAGSKQ